jgi:protein TonB
MQIAPRPHRRNAGRFNLLSALLSTYPVRLMLGLIASLGVLVLCFRLPVHSLPSGVGWGPQSAGSPITLKDVREAEPEPGAGVRDRRGAPITSFAAVGGETAAADDEAGRRADRTDPGTKAAEEHASAASKSTRPARLSKITPLHTLDRKPRVVGGIGGMYLKIGYPKAARRDSIEGRLLLHFVVEKDGATSRVRVAESLHPQCDSAAVRAVKRTRFVPGRRGGQAVRVAMHLPVQFKLVDAPLQASRSSSDAPQR